MLERVFGDREGKSVQTTLGRCRKLGWLLPIRKVCPLLLGLTYLLQPCLWLCFFICLGLCWTEASLWSVSDLILDLIHSEIVIIDLIPRICHLYFLQIFLAPSDTTITVMVSPIMMMMMLRAYSVRNSGSRWALARMRLSTKTPSLSHCPPLPFVIHSFYSTLISDRMVAKALAIGMVSGRL